MNLLVRRGLSPLSLEAEADFVFWDALGTIIGGRLGYVFFYSPDLLTKIDFKALLEFHKEEGSLATICVREYDFQVPYGVVEMTGRRLERIVEKPTHRFFVNAGIYVIDPRTLPWLSRNIHCDMPDFLERIRRRRPRSVSCFPIREYWIDIGRIEEYRRAQSEFDKFF